MSADPVLDAGEESWTGLGPYFALLRMSWFLGLKLKGGWNVWSQWAVLPLLGLGSPWPVLLKLWKLNAANPEMQFKWRPTVFPKVESGWA